MAKNNDKRPYKETAQDKMPKQAGLPVTDEQFRLMVESVKDYAIIMLDGEGRVVSRNAGAEPIK